MPKNPAHPDPRTLDLYSQLVASVPGVEMKGATMPYTAIHGNMYSMISSSGEVALRLPSPEREAFLAKYKTRLQTEHGIVREEYVLVPATLLAKSREIAPYFALSVTYARTLKPKPTTKSKSTRSSKTKSPRKRA